jgi:hypothetical protein
VIEPRFAHFQRGEGLIPLSLAAGSGLDIFDHKDGHRIEGGEPRRRLSIESDTEDPSFPERGSFATLHPTSGSRRGRRHEWMLLTENGLQPEQATGL